MNRFDLLNKIQNILKDNLVICNIGLPSQELYKISDQPNFPSTILKKGEKYTSNTKIKLRNDFK